MKDQSKISFDLLAEAAEWRLISLLFDCPTDEWFKQVAELGKQVSDKDLKKAAAAVPEEASEGLFHSVFGPGGPAPGREVSYRDWLQPGYLLAELSSFYEAFSYKPKTHEVPDHVSVETGFVAYLRLKQAFAVELGEYENAEITADASREFINAHLIKYTDQLAGILSNSDITYLSLAGKALLKRVGPDKEASQKRSLPVIEPFDESAEFECGVAGPV